MIQSVSLNRTCKFNAIAQGQDSLFQIYRDQSLDKMTRRAETATPTAVFRPDEVEIQSENFHFCECSYRVMLDPGVSQAYNT